MLIELFVQESNSTWILIDLPQYKNFIGCKWVYNTKFNANSTIKRNTTISVVNNYTQREDLDYLETFSLVANMVTVHSFFFIPSMQQLVIGI